MKRLKGAQTNVATLTSLSLMCLWPEREFFLESFQSETGNAESLSKMPLSDAPAKLCCSRYLLVNGPSSSSLNYHPTSPFTGKMSFLTKLKTETINEFLQRLRPTETSTSTGTWIYCVNERDEDVDQAPQIDADETGSDITGESESDDSDSEIGYVSKEYDAALPRGKAILEKLVEDLRVPIKGRTKKSLREEAVQALKQVAIECGTTVGKWVIFPLLSEVDDMWATIAKATVEGRLGSSAKVSACREDVSTEPSKPNKLICVYTNDFRKIDKVKEMLECLIELGVTPSCFKLDLYTYLKIDTKSRSVYGIAPGIYTPKSILEPVAKSTKKSAPPESRKRKPLIDLTNSLDDYD